MEFLHAITPYHFLICTILLVLLEAILAIALIKTKLTLGGVVALFFATVFSLILYFI